MLYRLSLIVLFWGTYFGLKADTYYFMADQSCMDRLKYTMSTGSNSVDQTIYHYDLGNGAKLILELAPGQGELARQLSGKLVTCGSNLVNENNYEMVGSPGNTKYVAIPQSGGQYRIIPVMMINYMEVNDYTIVYKDWQNAFTIQKNQARPGTVVNPNDNTGSKITLQSTSQRDCLTEYNLRQTLSFDPNATIEIVFIPEIGIIQKTSNTSNQALVSYNDKPLKQAVQEICQSGEPIASTPPPTTGPTPGQPAQRMHTVNSGETLFSISRQYSVSVSDIKKWNNLTSNTISPNMQLAVSPPPSTSTPPAPSPPGSPDTDFGIKTPYPDQPDYNFGGTITSPAAPNGTPSPSIPPAPKLPAWRTTNGTHVVLPGETVASIAKKYGYTEERFRDMNDLKPYENVRVNQVLKTTDRLTAPASTGSTTSRKSVLTTSSQPDAVVPFEPYGENRFFSTPAENARSVPSSGTGTNMSPKGGITDQPGASGSSNPPSSLDFYDPSGGASSSSPENSSFYQPGANRGTSTTPPGSNAPAAGSSPGFYSPGSSSARGNTTSDSGMYSNGVQFTATGMAADQIAKPMANGKPTEQQSDDGTHLVQAGESLFSIAQKYGLTIETLRQINNLEPGEIVIPGQSIYVRP